MMESLWVKFIGDRFYEVTTKEVLAQYTVWLREMGMLRGQMDEVYLHSQGVPSCTTVSAQDAAPLPTVARVRQAYEMAGEREKYVIRALYPSVLKEG